MQIKVEKLIYGGDGLGRLSADDSSRAKAVFVPFVLEGETADIVVEQEKPGFARGKLSSLVTASPVRIEARCPYFQRCGGCHYQHTSYEEQLRIKRDIFIETLQRTAKLTLDQDVVVHASGPWNYRNRTRMKVAVRPEFAVGYFRHGSHQLLPVRECPISSPLINRALTALWELGDNGAVSNEVVEVQWFANHDDSELLSEFYIRRGANPKAQERFANALQERIPESRGVTVFESTQGSADESDRGPLVSSRSGPSVTYGERSLRYRVGEHAYQVSAGSFFQTNRTLAEELLRLAVEGQGGDTALDLYAGVGLFSVPLSQKFGRVIAVEASPYSAKDLKSNVRENVSAVQATTEEFLRRKGAEKADLVVVDPPRNGLGESTARTLAASHAERITYVSCDPSTLARDLRVLLASGYKIRDAHLVDLFPQTFHMESVVHLIR